jgi:hypothetical protein
MSNLSTSRPPNIVFILADNLGWGELGCYGGGALRGAPTPRIDHLASEGLRFLNFNVESDCVPTRSALMTGRHPIRTGALQSVPAGLPQGLIPWEITLAQLISGQGYATACYGKWHLGDREGRYPKDRGFDEWYGIPRTTNESMFTSSPGFDPEVVPLPYVMEGVKGKPATNSHIYDLAARRRIDSELAARTIDFMTRQVKAAKPFFAYVPLTHLHYPTLPHPDFAGKTGAGDFADSMHEMDFRVGGILDAVDALGIRDETLVIFGSDNGPEFRRPWRGTAGPWTGTYHTSMEGALRVPFIFRWPDRIAAGQTDQRNRPHYGSLSDARARGGRRRSHRPADRWRRSARLFSRPAAGFESRRLRVLHQAGIARGEMARLEDAHRAGARTQRRPQSPRNAIDLQPYARPQGRDGCRQRIQLGTHTASKNDSCVPGKSQTISAHPAGCAGRLRAKIHLDLLSRG